MRSNCLAYACGQFLRRGGYLVIRRSRYGWWWHAEHTHDFRRFSVFVPLGPKRRRACPPLWFRGRVIQRWR